MKKGRTNSHIAICCAWAALVVAASTIPTAAGYLYAPEGSIFTGNARFTLDYNTYLSFIFQAREGHLLFQEMYWPWPNPSILFQPLFLLLGLLSRFTGISIAAAHEGGRILFGFLLLAALYKFISLIFRERFERVAAFVLVSSGGGLAWAYPWLNPGGITIEQHFITGWVEANTFLSILAFPLFSSSIMLMVLTFIFMLRFLETGGALRCALIGISSALLSLNHPYDLVIVACVAGPFLALSAVIFKQRFGIGRILLALASLSISISAVAVYHYMASNANPAFSYWASNMSDPSPPLTWIAANFGFIGPMAVLGVLGVLASGRRDPRLVFLAVWGAAGCIIIYLPFNFQRRLIEGLHVPLSLLAACGIFRLAGAKKNIRRYFSIFFILICMPANITTIWWSVEQLGENRGRLSPYITRGEAKSLDWLREHTRRGGAVLAGYRMSNYIPAFAGNHVFWGRWVNEADLAQRHMLVEMFFSTRTADSFRLEFAEKNNIRYLLWEKGPVKAGSLDPSSLPFLDPAYSNRDVTVFRVAPPTPP